MKRLLAFSLAIILLISIIPELGSTANAATFIVTREQLTEMGFVNINVESLNNTLKVFEINTLDRVTHFLAQIAQESALGKYTIETGGETYLKGKSYYPWIGAGYIQLTWESNYKDFAKYISGGDTNSAIYKSIYTPGVFDSTGYILVGTRYIAENYPWETAGYFWVTKKMSSGMNINAIIDNGCLFAGGVHPESYSFPHTDLVQDVSYIVNGGVASYPNRKAYYDKIKAVLENAPPILPGDANGDGKIDVTDILTLQNHILKILAIQPSNLVRADANGDGKINVLDIITVQNYILNTPTVTYFPKYTGSYTGIVDILNDLKIDSSPANRKLIGAANGMPNYLGQAAENTELVRLIKLGLLIKP